MRPKASTNSTSLLARITPRLADCATDAAGVLRTLDAAPAMGVGYSMGGALAQLVARDRWHDIETPGGPVRAMLPPVSFADDEPVLGPVPGLGQHNDLIRRELAGDQAPGEGSP